VETREATLTPAGVLIPLPRNFPVSHRYAERLKPLNMTPEKYEAADAVPIRVTPEEFRD
jgi:hypothetical protein